MKVKVQHFHKTVKRLGSLFLAVVILFTGSLPVMASESIPMEAVLQENQEEQAEVPKVFNSSFEEEIITDGTLEESRNWNAPSEGARTKKEVFEGKYSALLSKDNKIISQEITGLVKGMTYTVNFMAKKSQENTSDFWFGVSGHGGNESKHLIYSTEWENYSLDFTYTGNEKPVIFAETKEENEGKAFIDTVSIVAKGTISHLEASNGTVKVFYNEAFLEDNKKGSFTLAASVNGGDYNEIDFVEQEDILFFEAIKEIHTEQHVKLRLSYHKGGVLKEDYNSTEDYILEYVIPAAEKELLLSAEIQDEVFVGNNAETATNLLFNTGFEKEMTNLATGAGNLVGNWNRYLTQNGGQDVATRTNEDKRSGNYAGVITATGGAIEQDIANLTVGKTYVFKAYVKLGNGATGTDFILGAKNFGSGSPEPEQKVKVTADSWTEMSVEFTYSNSSRPARVYLYAATANGGKAYIDDTSLIQKDDDGSNSKLETMGGYLKNPSFEQDLTAAEITTAGNLTNNWDGHLTNDNLRLTTRETSPANVKSGVFSGKLTGTGASLKQDVSGLVKGNTYVYTIYGKLSNALAGTVKVGVDNYGGDKKTANITSTEWTPYSVEFQYTGDQLPRVFVEAESLTSGQSAFVDDASLVRKSDIDASESRVSNGSLTLKFIDTFTGNIGESLASSIAATYREEGGQETPLQLTFESADVAGKMITMNFPAIEKGDTLKVINITLTYTKSDNTTDVVNLAYTIEPEGTDYGNVVSMEASNGKVEVILDKLPTVGGVETSPGEEDFEFSYMVNSSGNRIGLTVSGFQWDAAKKAVSFSFTAIPASALGEQQVTIYVVYRKNQFAEVNAEFVIEQSQGTVYYVSSTGNDSNNGTSESTPFATINKLNSMTFQPGDRILFKKGDAFTGWFKPKGSGRAGAPIVIASYGTAADKPKLQPGDINETTYIISGDSLETNARVNYVIQFVNVEYWEVRDLEIVDPKGAWDRSVYRSGITIQANDTLNPTELILDHFIIDNCNIHGFHGPLTNIGKTSGGITMNVITNSDRNKSVAKKMQINGIRITNNEIWDVGRSGINFLNPWSDRQDAAKWGTGLGTQNGLEWTPYENFVLRNNYIHNVDGDGAIIDNTLNAIVEYNLVHDCVKNLVGGARFAVGLFNWNATNTIFQYNEVFDIQFGGDWAADCQGIEIDAWNDTTYVQYNYVHDNKGGFMMFCSHTQDTGDQSGLRSYNNVVRYNISQNDYAHPWMGIFNLGEWSIGGDIYNNTLYFTDRAVIESPRDDADLQPGQFYMFQSIGGKKMLRFYNNIFYYDYENTPSKQKVEINKFGDEHIDWRSNIFYGFTNKPIDDDPEYPNIHLDADDPDILTNPGGAGEGTYKAGHTKLGYQTDLSAYHLPDGSPAINKGIYIEDNGGKDYFGNPVTGIPDIGAHETGSVALMVLSHFYDVDQKNKTIELPQGDYATVNTFLGNLIYDLGLEMEILRGEESLTPHVILENNDKLKASYKGESVEYTINVTEGTSARGEYIPVEYLVATAGSQETASQQQQASKALDNDPRTFWHTARNNSTQDQHWINLEVTKPYLITGYEYTPRLGGSMAEGTDGLIKQYEILTSDDGQSWTKQAEGTGSNGKAWPATHSVKTVIFDRAVEANHVRLKSLEGVNDDATAAEVRLFGIPVYVESVKPEAPVLTDGPNGRTRIRLNWQTPEDESGIREYILKQGEDVIANLGGDALYYDVEGLQPETEYTFSLIAIDRAGNESAAGRITTGTTAEDGSIEYKLTFDSRNGKEVEVITWQEGEELVLPEEPVLEGAEFAGWFMMVNQKEVPFDPKMVITHNLNIYAKWQYPLTIDEDMTYWVYSVAEDGKGGYAPNTGRVLFDNGGEKANSGDMNTSNTMYADTMPDEQLRRRLLKSAWQFEVADEKEGTFYLQNGFTYGYAGSTESGGKVATVGSALKEKYLVTLEEVAVDGKRYVSIQSVTRMAAGQPSYLKAQNNTPSGDTAAGVSFGSTADKAQGTIWYIGEGHSFMDWDNGEYLWRTARGDQHFRIPALATANDGDVIAVGDLRYNHNGDLGGGHEIDILRRIRPYDASTETYGSFGKEKNITIGFRNPNEGYGDAAIVADRESDDVLILAAYGTEGYGGNNKASRILSTDGGETFGTGVDISPQIRGLNSNIHSFFFGSGRIMQSRYIKAGTHYRIYSAILACSSQNNYGSNVNYVLYSDDFGLTWNILGNTSVIENGNNGIADEAKIEELPNGDVVINSRNGNNPGRHMNVFSYATNADGTKDYSNGTWEANKTKQVFEGGDITSQGTNGEIMTVFARKKDGTYTHLMLQSLPSSQAPIPAGSNNTNRMAVTVWYKEMEDPSEDSDITAAELASTWKKGRVVQDKQSAYSTMAIQADGSIGFFYEDSMTWYDLIYYNFSLEEMTGAGAVLGDYEMAFKGIGSKKTPYQVDNQERATAYRDIFGAEKVNWNFSQQALDSLIPSIQSENLTNGEILAAEWKKVKDNQSKLLVTSDMNETEVLNLLSPMTGENVTITKAGEMIYTAPTGEGLGSVSLDVTIAYENTIAKVSIILPAEDREEVTYTVSFNSTGGGEVESVTVKENETVELPEAPKREGYTFLGWFTKENGEGEEFKGGILTEDITVYAHWKKDAVEPDPDVPPAEPDPDVPPAEPDPDLPSVSDNFFTVSFNSVSMNDIAPVTVKQGETIKLPVPIREGYTFEGWFTKENGEGTRFTDETPVNENIILYALWKEEMPEDPVSGIPTVSGSDIGQVLPEDVPADGIIPEGVWVAGVEDKYYTGTKQVQNFRVYDHKTMLKEKVDYTFSYKNHQNGYEYTEEDFEKFTEALKNDPAAKGAGSFEAKKAPQVVIKMKGNYTKKVSVYFRIIKPDIGDVELFKTDDLYATGNNKKQTPAPLVIWTEGGKILKLNKDFEVQQYNDAKKDKNAFSTYKEGGYELLLKGKGNFKGERNITLYITESSSETALSSAKVKLEYASATYDGSEKNPGVTSVKVKKDTLTLGTHYNIVRYENNLAAGIGSVILEAVPGSGYVGSKRVTFTIKGTPLSKVKLDLPKEGYAYTGEEIRPMELRDEAGNAPVAVTYTAKGTSRKLEEGVHYYVAGYEKNTIKGTASVILRGIPEGGFTGEKKQPFKIVSAPITDNDNYSLTVSGPNLTGDGESRSYTVPVVKGGVKPQVSIIYRDCEERPLIEGVDFTVSYPKNKAVGSTVIKIKGKGNFAGGIDIPLTIIAKDNQQHVEAGEEVTIVAKDKVEALNKKNGWKTSIRVVDRDGKALSARESGIKDAKYYLIEVPEGSSLVPSEETPLTLGSNSNIPAGSVIRVVTTLGGNYRGTATGTYRILKEGYDISKAKIRILPKEYTGEAVEITDHDFKAAVLKSKAGEKQLYLSSEGNQEANIEVVSYEKNLKKGTAKVTFKGKEGTDFGGTKTVTFKITARNVWKDYWKGLF